MKKNVLFVLLEKFADWEGAYLASELEFPSLIDDSGYTVKTVALSKDPVQSIGGFKVLPDYDLDSIPKDYDALVLIGGTSWRKEIAKKILPLIDDAIHKDKVIGAICDGSVFFATHGYVNHINHTADTLEDLLSIRPTKYKNQSHYQEAQAVRDGQIVTANGSAAIEFAKEMLIALNVYDTAQADVFYNFNKNGQIAYLKAQKENNS
jgi:putative intracellular protease/amidase